MAWRKPFFTLFAGQALSLLSSNAVQFAIIWWITIQTGSAIALTVASIAGLLPQVLLGPFAGVLIDRYSRTKVMAIADVAVAAASLALGISFIFGTPPLVFIYAILIARAVGETFHKPALQAAIPQIVPQSELIKAGGLGQFISSLCSMAGPMLGALLAGTLPMQFVMLVDCAGAVLAVLILSRVKTPPATGTIGSKPDFMKELKAGFVAFRKDPALIGATIPIFLTGMVFMPLGSLLPLMVREYFRGEAWQGGLVQTIFSIGMLAAALTMGIFGRSSKTFFWISFSSLLLGICCFSGGLLPPGAFWAFCIVVFIIGSTGMMGNIPYMAYIQKSVSPENLGKVISFVTSLVSLGIPLGLSLAGPIAERVGVSRWMMGAGALMILIGLGSYFMTRRSSSA